MTEFGLFSDEGCVENGLFSQEEAEEALAAYDPEDGLVIAPICRWHQEQQAESCEECSEEE